MDSSNSLLHRLCLLVVWLQAEEAVHEGLENAIVNYYNDPDLQSLIDYVQADVSHQTVISTVYVCVCVCVFAFEYTTVIIS